MPSKHGNNNLKSFLWKFIHISLGESSPRNDCRKRSIMQCETLDKNYELPVAIRSINTDKTFTYINLKRICLDELWL
jgi:hypothetical protein